MGNVKNIHESDLVWKIQQERLRSETTERTSKELDSVKNGDTAPKFFSSGDSVQISLAKRINEELNVDNSCKISRLKEQIANGTYKPDLMKVASSFLTAIEDEINVENIGNI